ncbi:MAG: HAD family hydrolase [Pseudomonadota bacterium]
MALRALLFDVDGTLADTEDAHRQSFNRAFVELGYDWRWERPLYRELLRVTGGKERLRHFWQTHHPEFAASHDIVGLAAELHKVKTGHYVGMMKSGGIPLRPGIVRLLDEARAAGLLLAIATTTTYDNIAALLTANLGEESIAWFAAIGAGDCVPQKKPAPNIYHWVMDKLGVAASECMAFEDSENGLVSATRAGLDTIVTVNAYTEGQDFGAAIRVLPDLDGVALPEIVSWHGACRGQTIGVA